MRRIALILTFALLCGCAAAQETPNTEQPTAASTPAVSTTSDAIPADATPAPTEPEPESEPLLYRDFTAYRQDGTAVTLSDYIGTPIVINFWTTWCGPCRSEMPHFDKTEDEYPDVLFFMVNLTDGQTETPEAVEQFLADNDLTFANVLLDTDADAYMTYGISSIPVTLFINADGHIVNGRLGAMSEETLRAATEELLR